MYTLFLKVRRKDFHCCVSIIHTSNKCTQQTYTKHFIGILSLLQLHVNSSPCPSICSRADYVPARPLPAPSCEQEVASLQCLSPAFIDATIPQQYKLLEVSFECNP